MSKETSNHSASQMFSPRGCLMVVCVLVIPFWFVAKEIRAETVDGAKERWVFTTSTHFTLYGLLLGAPIYRDQIRAVVLTPEIVYVAVVSSRNETQLLALDRRQGQPAWQVAIKGHLIWGQLILAGEYLVAAFFDESSKEATAVRIDPANGRVRWMLPLPAARAGLVGDEVILKVHPNEDTVVAYFTAIRHHNRLVMRASDGKKIAESSFAGYFWRSGVHESGDLIFAYDGRMRGEYDRLLSFREKNGQTVWMRPLSRHWASPPTVIDNSLLITDKTHLSKIDILTGNLHWSEELTGTVPPTPSPPLVIEDKILVIHQEGANSQNDKWRLSIRRLADGKEEHGVALSFGEPAFPDIAGRMDHLAIVGSTFRLQIVDIKSAKVLGSLDFKKLLSWFVFSDLPRADVADSDPKGFTVVTSDGKLRYFAAEDFGGATFSQAPPQGADQETSRFTVGMIFYYLVVNPLWDILQASQTMFWVLFYGFPFLALGLLWVWKPTWAWLRRVGVLRGAKWGCWTGVIFSLPAGIYRGLMGGIAAGFGSYGAFGPIWGGIVGFATFIGVGLVSGLTIGSLCSLPFREKAEHGRRQEGRNAR